MYIYYRGPFYWYQICLNSAYFGKYLICSLLYVDSRNKQTKMLLYSISTFLKNVPMLCVEMVSHAMTFLLTIPFTQKVRLSPIYFVYRLR